MIVSNSMATPPRRIRASCVTILVLGAWVFLATAALGESNVWRGNGPYGGSIGALVVDAALYELLRTQPSTVYYDILLGDNIRYKAGPGYDRCIGVGTIKADALAQALVA